MYDMQGYVEDVYNVSGEAYKVSREQMSLRRQRLADRDGKLFDSKEECEKFAVENKLNILAYNKMGHGYLHVGHTGKLLTEAAWQKEYGNTLFMYRETDEDGRDRVYKWKPSRFTDYEQAYCVGEISDGELRPLYSRNYFLPYGFFDETTGTYNVARGYKYFAGETGADTSYIYELLQHIGGECYKYLLAWLRTKLLHPTSKTGIMPVFTSEAQGTGKTTFGEVICKALFNPENVLVTDRFDASARFNSDQVDMLIISIEEKMQEDRRNSVSALKNAVTNTHVRKESKGIDPIEQLSYTDYVMSTNDPVPIKFEGRSSQRRFMVMEADENFTREKSAYADEVFTKLYGYDARGVRKYTGLVNDGAAIEQFKYELLTNKELAETNIHDFPHTDAYRRCFSIPRTNEALAIEQIMLNIAPFIEASLKKYCQVTQLTVTEDEGKRGVLYLDSVIDRPVGMRYRKGTPGTDAMVILNNAYIFKEADRNGDLGKAYAHPVILKTVLSMKGLLREKYGIELRGDTSPMEGYAGFPGITGRERMSNCLRFSLVSMEDKLASVDTHVEVWPTDTKEPSEPSDPPKVKSPKVEIPKVEIPKVEIPKVEISKNSSAPRSGVNARYNMLFKADPNGEFETLNKVATQDTRRVLENALSMDVFLLEADETTPDIREVEKRRLDDCKTGEIQAMDLYRERLMLQDAESDRLIDEGTAFRSVYSGSKSIHVLVRIKDAPNDLDERKWLDAYIKSIVSTKVKYDIAVADPLRLTRAPISKERKTRDKHNTDVIVIGEQRLLRDSPNSVWDLRWRKLYNEWKENYRKSKTIEGRIMPCAKEYQDAAKALCNETFFTDPVFDGQRNRLFFSAYKLLRCIGFSHKKIWDEMYRQIPRYKKKEEINYWMTRESCRLIKIIDDEVDGYKAVTE